MSTHPQVTGVTHDAAGLTSGATVRDVNGGASWTIRAKAVVNATGPFGDAVRVMDDANAAPLITGASGALHRGLWWRVMRMGACLRYGRLERISLGRWESCGRLRRFEERRSAAGNDALSTKLLPRVPSPTQSLPHRAQLFPPMRTSAGVHIVLPDHFSPDNMGLIIPKTRDGRVLFFLPWEGASEVEAAAALVPTRGVGCGRWRS